MAVEKIDKSRVKYRKKDFKTAECEYCRYYLDKECKVVADEIDPEWVCNAWQGEEDVANYKVSDMGSFIKGMILKQPYQHKVLDGFNSPVGWLLIIQDTMKPKPHVFSLDLDFHMVHTSREHHWTQGEVNKLIVEGKTDQE